MGEEILDIHNCIVEGKGCRFYHWVFGEMTVIEGYFTFLLRKREKRKKKDMLFLRKRERKKEKLKEKKKSKPNQSQRY